MDMNMNPEIINDNVRKYVDEVKKLQDCKERFDKVNDTLSSWHGVTKQKLNERMEAEKPAFEELIKVVESYANTAQSTADNVIAVEDKLTRMLG